METKRYFKSTVPQLILKVMMEEKWYSRNRVEIQLRKSLITRGKKMANRMTSGSVQHMQHLKKYSFTKREQKKNKSILLRRQF